MTGATAVATLLMFASSAGATFGGRNGDLAFTMQDVPARDDAVYMFRTGLVSPTGRNTRFVARGLDPAFSPNGRALALTGERGGIKLTRLSGRVIRFVTHASDSSPAWSPSGRRVAFARQSCDLDLGFPYEACTSRGIFTVGRDGGDLKQLTDFGVQPVWSRTGDIAFIGSAGGTRATGASSGPIYVMPGDGGPLTRVSWRASSVDWSPDGTRLVFTREVDVYDMLFVANADGTRLKRLYAARSTLLQDPRWAPDGRSIMFLQNYKPYRIAPTGTHRRRAFRFSCEPCEERFPVAISLGWQPLPR